MQALVTRRAMASKKSAPSRRAAFQVVLFAGGTSRLYPLTNGIPKPLLPVSLCLLVQHALVTCIAIVVVCSCVVLVSCLEYILNMCNISKHRHTAVNNQCCCKFIDNIATRLSTVRSWISNSRFCKRRNFRK